MSERPIKSRAGLKRDKYGRSVSKLTHKLARRLVKDIVRSGNYVETACAINGIASSTLRLWLKKGRQKPRSKYGALVRMLNRAEAQQESREVRVITTAAKKNWTASAWLLERKHPKRWGREKDDDKKKQLGPNILVDNRQIVVKDAEEAKKLRDGLAILRRQDVIPAKVTEVE